MGSFVDHVGKQYKMLKVISYAGTTGDGKNRKHSWNCVCKCGKSCITRSDKLHIYSCGCLQRKAVKENNKKRIKKGSHSAKNTLFLNYKKGAKDRGLSFNLSFEEFMGLTKLNCFYCGVKPKQIQKASGGNYIYNGIDRKSPKIGYTTNNCTPCCKICNRAKLDMSFKSFQNYLTRFKNDTFIKKFYLLRHEDINSNSGVGIVAVGVKLPSGKCIMEWLSNEITETIFESVEQIIRIHGHQGDTELVWDDPPCDEDKPKAKKSRKKKDE